MTAPLLFCCLIACGAFVRLVHAAFRRVMARAGRIGLVLGDVFITLLSGLPALMGVVGFSGLITPYYCAAAMILGLFIPTMIKDRTH